MRRVLPPLVVLALVALALASTAAATDRSCGYLHGTVVVRGTHHAYSVRYFVARGRVSCATARRVLSSLNAGKARRHRDRSGAKTYYTLPGGWACTGGTSCARSPCRRRRARDVIYAYAIVIGANR